MYQDIILRIEPEKAAEDGEILRRLARSAGLRPDEIHDYRIIRKSVDARKSPIVLNLTVRIAVVDDYEIKPLLNPIKYNSVSTDASSLIIVGAGPAGLFSALEAIRQGIKPIIFERGADVEQRRIDLAEISRTRNINPKSNYCFGEGGAGAYSDGKLYTRSKKRGSIEEVLQILVQHGASENILIESHPHIGSDKLPSVIKNIRETIIQNGGEVHFNTMVTGLITENGVVTGVKTDNGIFNGDGVILATGHSAHDTFRDLLKDGVEMQSKGIAVGVRLEHPQELIDKIQYKSHKGRGKYLPAAEYSFVAQSGGRGVYSFCMCPGGVIVPAGTTTNELVVNGMSASARAGKWANSGMVVELHPGDLPELAKEGPLEMLEVQEKLEKSFFESSDNSIVAPAQRMLDFVEKKKSSDLPSTSYAPGIVSKDFNVLFPEFIADRLRDGFVQFGKKARGFLTNRATMIGLESRTSSPVRMVRDKSTLESVSLKRLYPAGEGAGYAGGIVSAAVDGIRCTRAFASALFGMPSTS